MILFVILGVMLTLYIILGKRQKRKDIISVYFGVPGSGKTTFAAYLSKKDRKKGRKVWSNVPITGTYKLDCKDDLGTYAIENGSILIDEAGIDFNNRAYKSLPQKVITYLKYHRHWRTSIDVFSQSHEDMDITIRRLAQRYFVVKKSLIPNFIVCKSIGRRVGIDQNTKQIIDEYFWKPFGTKWIYSRPLWKLFNTLSHDELPEKEWETW